MARRCGRAAVVVCQPTIALLLMASKTPPTHQHSRTPRFSLIQTSLPSAALFDARSQPLFLDHVDAALQPFVTIEFSVWHKFYAGEFVGSTNKHAGPDDGWVGIDGGI